MVLLVSLRTGVCGTACVSEDRCVCVVVLVSVRTHVHGSAPVIMVRLVQGPLIGSVFSSALFPVQIHLLQNSPATSAIILSGCCSNEGS